MEISEVFRILEKSLEGINSQTGFKRKSVDDSSIVFSGESGIYRVVFDEASSIMSFECAYDNTAEQPEFNVISKSLFDAQTYNERDVKSLGNEIKDEIDSLFNTKKKVNLDKVKMPKSVSRSMAKNGSISYDAGSLANRFGAMYPEFKDIIKQMMIDYDEFLPETFFMEHGTAKVLDVIANGTEAERKKLFKMLNDIYEDGTNEVQDIIGVTILGEMKNDPELMAVADKYMSDYMAKPVHEINKIMAKNSSLTKKLKNPPPYKPKKKKSNPFAALMGQTPNN